MAFIKPMIPRFSKDNNAGGWSVILNIECGDNHLKEIWYRFPSGPLSNTCDFIVPICLAPAMSTQTSLKIPGKVSARLMHGVENIQQIFKTWDSKFSILNIQTDGILQEQAGSGSKVACFFSGGVDSAYTLLKHLDEIDSIIFVVGFDMRLDKEPLRTETSKAIKTIAQKLGKDLIEVETNLKDFSDLFASWNLYYHGAALASIALLLSAQFKKIYIPATHTYKDLLPWGSHPLLDSLWGTETVQIIHDGCEAGRIEKTSLLSRNDVILEHLRVCWENRGGAYNCCECEKCLRTMINLKAIGALERCKAFKKPLNLSLVARIEINDANTKAFVEENLRAIEKQNNDRALAQALRKSLKGYWKGPFGWRYFARKLVSKYPILSKFSKFVKKFGMR